MAKKILAAVDGSEYSRVAFHRALELAKLEGAELLIVHAIPDTLTGGLVEYGTMYGSMAIVHSYYEAAKKGAIAWIKPLEEIAKQHAVSARSEILWELGKRPVQMITEYAEKNGVSIIVMGTTGLGGLKRIFLGSVASGVLNHAHCSVMVVRE